MNIQTTTILHDEKTTKKMMCRLSDEELALCKQFGINMTSEQLHEELKRILTELQDSTGIIEQGWRPYQRICGEL